MYTGEEITSDALCILCNEVLPNSSMLPVKLYKHHDTTYPEYRDRVISFIRCKSEALSKCQSLMVKSSKTDNEKATEASYRVSYRTALAGEVLTVAEIIINHAWWQQQLVCLVSSQKQKLETVQLSNNTVKCHI
jgi:hypothetical protein